MGSLHQGVTLKIEAQPYNSPLIQFQGQPKECTRAMEASKKQDEHKANHGKVKTNKDSNVTTISQFKERSLVF